MGITISTWLLPSSFHPRGDRITSAVIAQRLRAVTGLQIETQKDGGLRFPDIREKLFDWEIEEHSITVYGYTPAHPYLWENLDAIMVSLGGKRDDVPYKWKPDPAYLRLRTRWNALPALDRLILRMPSLIGTRPLDGMLISVRSTPR
jgi:hypothetical protein